MTNFARNARLRTGRNEYGVAYPSPLVMLSIIAVAMAGIAFVATNDQDLVEQAIVPAAAPSASAAPTPTAEPTPKKKPKPKPPVERGEVFVEVFNNTRITGLAGRIGARATDAGWQVVGSDNWVGTIPATTVYYPARLKRAAKLLALDLGVSRTQPAVESMKLDRLTVVLTGDVT